MVELLKIPEGMGPLSRCKIELWSPEPNSKLLGEVLDPHGKLIIFPNKEVGIQFVELAADVVGSMTMVVCCTDVKGWATFQKDCPDEYMEYPTAASAFSALKAMTERFRTTGRVGFPPSKN